VFALSTIYADLSRLSGTNFIDTVEQEGNDFWLKLGTAQLYDDVSALLIREVGWTSWSALSSGFREIEFA
jgi:hypothetical protein